MIRKNQICFIEGTEYKDMTIRLLTGSGLKELIPSKNARIGIKPNLVAASPAETGATTHPEVCAGLIEYLQANGFYNLVMLEGSWVGEKTSDAIEVCGYDTLIQRYGVPFIDTQKEKAVPVDCAGMEISICRAALDLDFLINVPVLKGHCQTKVTCALKNMKGLIPNREKRRFHAMGLMRPIAHLNTALRQDFILVDNICGDLDFEDGGNPVVMNRLLCGRDPVLMDSYVCHLMHYAPEEIPYITFAEELGVGCADLKKAEVLSPENTSPKELPLSRKVVLVEDHVQEVESCSACYGCLLPALERLREEGLLDSLPGTVCIGQGFRGKSGDLGIGSCTALFREHLDGCPPLEDEIYSFLRRMIKT